jgi:hypothetical protein
MPDILHCLMKNVCVVNNFADIKMLKIEIDTNNEAFDSPNGNNEIKIILIEVTRQIELGRNGSFLLDSNGNTVGKWAFDSEKMEI